MSSSARASPGPSRVTTGCDKENEGNSKPWSVLSSTKVELELALEAISADESRSEAIAATLPAKVRKCLESLADLPELPSNERILFTKEFLELVALFANCFDKLCKTTCDNLDSCNGAIDECIVQTERIVASDLKLNCDENFREIMENVSRTCFARQPYSKRHYVALIKIHSRLLDKVDDPLLPQGHIAALIHNMGGEIRSSLISTTDQNWKLVAFLVKRIAYLSAKFAFLSGDPQFIGTVEKLLELRLYDHPLNKGIEKIELWKLIDFEKLKMLPTENMGVGHVLLCCDLSEHMPGFWENKSSIEFCIREIYRHASDIFKFMFHRVEKFPLFDHCLRVLIRGFCSLGEAGIIRDIVSDQVSIEQQLLHDELCRYIRRKTGALDTGKVTSASLLGCLNQLIPSRMMTAELQLRIVKLSSLCLSNRYITPCSPASALLSSLVSTHFAENAFGKMSFEDFVALAEEQVDIMTENPSNDCLFLSACTFLSYARDFPLSGVENARHRAPFLKLQAIASLISQNDFLNAFGATSLIVFAFATDLPAWLNLSTRSHEKYFRSFERKFDHDQWNTVLLSLKRGKISTPLSNFYCGPRNPQPVPPPPIGGPGPHSVGGERVGATPTAVATLSNSQLVFTVLDCCLQLRSQCHLPLTGTDAKSLQLAKSTIESILERR